MFKVLIVEDDDSMAVALRDGFRYEGYDVNLVRDGEEGLRIFLSRMNMREADLAGLEKEWLEYIQKFTTTGSSVRGHEEAGLRAHREGRTFRAIRLLKAAIDAGSKRAQVHLAYGACLMQRGLQGDETSRAEAGKFIESAIELEPLDADAWAQRAFLTFLSGNEPEGERLLALAREIDPEADFLDLETWVKVRAAIKGGDE